MIARRLSSPTVLVTDAGRTSALAIIRSLGKRGCRVIAADARPGLGFRSRHAAERLVYPPPDLAAGDFLAALERFVRQHHVDLVIPVTDATLLPLAEARDRLGQVTRLAIPAAEALEVATNKLKTLELAERLGVPTPATRRVETVDEALARADELGWPLVVKPQASWSSTGDGRSQRTEVVYAADRDELAERMRRFEGRVPVLLQAYCPGAGQGVELLLHQGRPLAAFQHRRLREVPVSGGASSFRESVPLDPVLYGYAVKLLSALSWTGLAMVEFKLGRCGPLLMEINGRVWGSLPLAIKSGIDFPARLVDLLLDGPPPGNAPPQTSYRIGVRSRNLELDMVWIGAVLLHRRRYPFLPYPSRLEAVAALVGLFNPRSKFDVLCLDDPWPATAELGQIFRKLKGKMKQ